MTNEYIIRIHDTKAMIYDTFDYNKFKQGFDYLDCIEEGTDYESYDENDIVKLHSKLEQHLNEITQAIKTKNFEKAILLEDCCIVVEKY